MSDWADVAPASAIARDGCVVIDLDGVAVAVFHVEGAFFAIEDECSHETNPLSDGRSMARPSSARRMVPNSRCGPARHCRRPPTSPL